MFPNGKLIKSQAIKEPPSEIIQQLKENNFTGYIDFTLKDENGIHDTSIALINGKIASANCESFKKNENNYGENALKLMAKFQNTQGHYDIVELTEEQVKLALAVKPEGEVKNIVKEKTQETSEEILRKYGLSSLAKSE